MDVPIQKTKAQAFRRMHDGSQILVLPNAWDAASSRIIEEAGARAIATSSAGVAYALGDRDGQYAPRDEAIAVIARSLGSSAYHQALTSKRVLRRKLTNSARRLERSSMLAPSGSTLRI